MGERGERRSLAEMLLHKLTKTPAILAISARRTEKVKARVGDDCLAPACRLTRHRERFLALIRVSGAQSGAPRHLLPGLSKAKRPSTALRLPLRSTSRPTHANLYLFGALGRNSHAADE